MQSKSKTSAKISLFFKPVTIKAYFVFFSLILIASMPSRAHASFFSDLINTALGADTNSAEVAPTVPQNSQTIPLLESSVNPDVKNADQTDITIVGDQALATDNGLVGQGAEDTSNGEITVYEVKPGDTLSEIAQNFDVSMNTIIWENNLTSKTVRVGQKLSILPVTGVKHIVKNGDTLDKIANKYDADIEDIMVYNDLSRQEALKQGDIIIVPNGTITVTASKPIINNPRIPSVNNGSRMIPNGYYLKPTSGIITSPYGPRKRGYHYGVDIGTPRGTAVIAAASGVVVKAINYCREGQTSCGGRYGNYIAIEHSNGQTTLYAHLSKVYVSVGQEVSQGKTIGASGNTGRSTGPHLHFQVENESGATIRPKF